MRCGVDEQQRSNVRVLHGHSTAALFLLNVLEFDALPRHHSTLLCQPTLAAQAVWLVKNSEARQYSTPPSFMH